MLDNSISETLQSFHSIDFDTLIARVQRQKDNGHCGESTSDVIWRQGINEQWTQIEHILSVAKSLTEKK